MTLLLQILLKLCAGPCGLQALRQYWLLPYGLSRPQSFYPGSA